MAVTVYRRHCEGIGFEAVARLAGQHRQGPGVLAIVFSAQKAAWATVNAGGSVVPELDADPYESRIFDGKQEWRWLKQGHTGEAWWVAEDVDLKLPGWRSVDPKPAEVRRRLDHHYLLWGRADGSRPRTGWSRLLSARTGPIEVPVILDSGRSAALVVAEYLAVLDEHGNVGLWDERLVDLKEARETA